MTSAGRTPRAARGAAIPKRAGASLPGMLGDLATRAAMQLGDGYRIEIERRADQLSALLEVADRVVAAKQAHYAINFDADQSRDAALEEWADHCDELERAVAGVRGEGTAR